MTFLPLVVRELRTRSRRGATWWGRGAVALLVFLIMTPGMTFGNLTAGREAYDALSWVAFGFVILGGLLTVDSISGERREGTLGLLFLTDLRGYDVVLGKMAVNGLWTFHAIFALVPLLAVTFAAGGVTGGEVVRICLVLLVTVFLSLATGVLVSTGRMGQGKATGILLMTMFGLMVGPIIIEMLAGVFPVVRRFSILSPFELFQASSDARFVARPSDFWLGLIAVAVLGCLAVFLSGWRLTSDWHDHPSTSSAVDRHRAGRKPPREGDPIIWLAQRQRGQTTWTWVALGLSNYSLVRALTAMFGASPASWYAVSLIFNLASVGILAWVAGRFFMETRRAGLMELLLTVPEGARRLIKGQWRVLWRLIRVPLLLIMVWTLISSLLSLRLMSGSNATVYFVYGLGRVVLIAVETISICWLGMYFGMRFRNVVQVIVAAIAAIVLFPWIVVLPLSLVFRTFNWVNLLQLFAIGAVYMLIFLWARWGLLREPRSNQAGDTGSILGLGELWQRGLSIIRRARHWTPS